MHLTLKFFGEIRLSQLRTVGPAVRSVLHAVEPFAVSFLGMGIFPRNGAPRVVFAGVKEGRDELCRLYEVLDDALFRVGFSRDRRGFHPHLTICRLRSPKAEKELRSFVEENRNRAFGRALIDRIRLYRSRLTRKGPIYTLVEEWDM